MWALKILLLVAVVLSAGLLAVAVAKGMARRTIGNWAGRGVHSGLDPAGAALLLGLHPSLVVFEYLLDLGRRGRARIADVSPVRLEWTGDAPEDPAEEAIERAARESGGRPAREDVAAILGEIYDRTNAEMAPFSGRATAVHFRRFVHALWRQAVRGADLDPAIVPWLLLGDPLAWWDALGRGPGHHLLRAEVRRANRFRAHLLPGTAYGELARDRTGYFRYMPEVDDSQRVSDVKYFP